MSENNAESSSSSDRTEALAGLPASERAETEAILNELDSEASKGKPEDTTAPDGKKPEEAAKPDGKTADDGKKPDGEPGTKADEVKPEGRRDTKMMPVWAHEAFKDKTTKEIETLKADLEAAKNGNTSSATGTENAQGPDAISEDAIDKAAREIAEKNGISEDLAKDLLKANQNLFTIPSDITSKLSRVDELTAIREAEVETAQFNADFDRIILPALKAEYGDEIPPETVSKVREDLKELAYDPSGTYAKVPYITIFKGEDRFRDILPPLKRGPEGSRPGATAQAGALGHGEGPDLTKTLSDDVIRTLSGEQFDTYMENMAKSEKK